MTDKQQQHQQPNLPQSQQQQQDILVMENFDMLKALYDFQAVYPRTISFDEGEYFILHQTSVRQRNWWQVVSMKGNIGFVPSNYVMKLKVEPSFLIGFLDSSIESLKLSRECEINGIILRTELIEKLEEKKKQAIFQSNPHNNVTTPLTPPTKEERCHKIGNGTIKMKDCNNIQNDKQHHQSLPHKENKKHHHKNDITKKSMSTPTVGTQMPQLIQESPSMGVLTTKIESINGTQQSTYDNSIASEPSETTTTTSEDITTISKIDEITVHDVKEIILPKETDKDDDTLKDVVGVEDIINKDEEEPIVIDSKKVVKSEISNSDESAAAVDADASVVIAAAGNDTNANVNNIDVQEVYQIVDAIRQSTSLSHELSCVALRVVLSELEVLLPVNVTKALEPIAAHLTGPVHAPDTLLGQTHDAQRLRIIFTELTDCKNDSQQRSWMLYEDEDDIREYLKELINILKTADPKICRHEMSCDQYQSIFNLIMYFQMETRWSIRKLLLDAFTAMCHLDYTAVDILNSSVLPLELVEGMKTNAQNVDRLKELSIMLTIIFSIGQKLPVIHQENINIDFILFIMDIIEVPPDTDNMEILPDIMINLLLSFNLQFDNFLTNIIIEAMKQIKTANTFTEKILLLINREDDPVKLLKHTSPPSNSVLKMFVDLFSLPETASLFYTNDNKVLIDILVRQLSDLSPGDPLRKWYLELCRRIVRNTSYQEHTHRKQDLMKIFTRIFCEETECSASDQQLVRDIANEFPQIFKA